MANFLNSLWNSTVQLLENWSILTPETSANLMKVDVIDDKKIRDLVNKATNKIRKMRDISQSALDDLWTNISQMSNTIGSPDLNEYISKSKREMRSQLNNLRNNVTKYDAIEESLTDTANDFKNTSTKYRTSDSQDWQDLQNKARKIDNLYEEKINDKKEKYEN